MKYLSLLLAFLLVGMLACSDELLTPADEPQAATLSASKNGKIVPRPLKGRFAMDAARVAPEGCDEGLQPTEFDIAGNATHLGLYTGTTFDCFNFVPISIDPLTFEFTDGEVTLIAANGDKLHIEYTGTSIVEEESCSLEFSGPITGGTGRFDGATSVGDVTFTGECSFDPTEAQGTFEGTVVY